MSHSRRRGNVEAKSGEIIRTNDERPLNSKLPKKNDRSLGRIIEERFRRIHLEEESQGELTQGQLIKIGNKSPSILVSKSNTIFI
jgi:hypothetical protein